MMRAKAILLAALVLTACTELNVKPRPNDDGSFPLDGDGALDAPSDVVGQAGFAGGGNGGGGAGGMAGAGGKGGMAGAGGVTQAGGRGGGGAGGATKGAGGATASCPASATTPCTPNMTDTAEEVCCATGKRTRSRKCDPVTCQWGAFGAWSACAGVQAVCTPGATTSCTNGDPCGNRVCTSACNWGACVPQDAGGCLCIRSDHTDCGSNYRCGTGSHAGQWQFCLKSSCTWSTDWEDCGAQNCEC